MRVALGGDLPAGTLIQGRYRLDRVLGRGGFGAVYLAEQLATGQQVALKVLLVDRGDPTADREVARFQREMRLVGQLAHPNVVRLIDFGELEDGRLFIAFEYIRGQDLAHMVEELGAIPVRQAQRLMVQVLEALAAAHQQGIVHRDLKPQNVMVTNLGPRANAMVVDFGVSFVAEDRRDAHYRTLTARDELAGTPPYMAPEQLLEGQASPRSDLYSWGLVFLEALTGQPAYEETSFIKLLLRHSRALPVTVPEVLRDSPLGPVLARALAYAPEQRYGSAEDALHELEAVDWRDHDVTALEERLRDLAADWRQSLAPSAPLLGGAASPAELPDMLSIDSGPHEAVARAAPTQAIAETAVDSWNDRIDRGLRPPRVIEPPAARPLTPAPVPAAALPSPPATGRLGEDTPPAGMPVRRGSGAHPIATIVPITEDDLDYSDDPTMPAAALANPPATPPSAPSVRTEPVLAVRTQPFEAVPHRRRWPLMVLGMVAGIAITVAALLLLRGDGRERAGREGRVRERPAATRQTPEAPSPRAEQAAARPVTPPPQPPGSAASVLIPGGPFVMGCDPAARPSCPPDAPAHAVELDPYEIDINEVSVVEYARCVDDQACRAPEAWSPGRNPHCNWGHPDRAEHPVNCLSFIDAQIYCEWRGRRLPTEAEWERAARGQRGSTFPWGDTPPACDRAVMTSADGACQNASTAPVGSRPDGATAEGVLDMAGNVWEWTADWYNRDFYSVSPLRNPMGPPGGQERVTRGGGWDDDESDMTSFARNSDEPWEVDDDVGFRCAASR